MRANCSLGREFSRAMGIFGLRLSSASFFVCIMRSGLSIFALLSFFQPEWLTRSWPGRRTGTPFSRSDRGSAAARTCPRLLLLQEDGPRRHRQSRKAMKWSLSHWLHRQIQSPKSISHHLFVQRSKHKRSEAAQALVSQIGSFPEQGKSNVALRRLTCSRSCTALVSQIGSFPEQEKSNVALRRLTCSRSCTFCKRVSPYRLDESYDTTALLISSMTKPMRKTMFVWHAAW